MNEHKPKGPEGKGPGSTAKGLPPPTQGRRGNRYPDVEVLSHRGQRYRFFEDLIRDKVVLVNFMSVRGHAHFPVTQHMARIADALGDRLGRDVFIYSITTDPESDSPEHLKALADRFGAREGWHFLTALRNDVEALSAKMFRGKRHGRQIHPTRLVHYGNGGVGIWGAFAADCDPKSAAIRVAWVQNGVRPSGPIRRAGPRRLGHDFKSTNRA